VDRGLELVEFLFSVGFPSWLVGGIVRDHLSGRISRDIDVAVQADPGDLRTLFPAVSERGSGKRRSFVISYRECPFEIVPLWGKTLNEDLKRRDFTVNSMAMDRKENIIDPFGGRKDLHNSLLRFTDDPVQRIREDPVRLLRFCRFTATLNMEPEGSSSSAVREMGSELIRVPAERKGYEVFRALTEGKLGSFLMCAVEHGLFPFLDPGRGKVAQPDNVLYLVGEAEKKFLPDYGVAAAFFAHAENFREVMERWSWPVSVRKRSALILKGLNLLEKADPDERELALYAFTSGLEICEVTADLAGCSSGDTHKRGPSAGNVSLLLRFAVNLKKGPCLPGGRKIMEVLGIGPGKILGEIKKDLVLEKARGNIIEQKDIYTFLEGKIRES